MHHTFTHGGIEREYWLHRPCCSADATAQLPLVLMLHGWGETGAQYAGLEAGAFSREGADRWIEESERGCFVVAWPQGLLTQLGHYKKHTSWNAGGCSSAASDLCNTRTVKYYYGDVGLCSADTCGGTCDACAWCTCADDVDFVVSLTRELLAAIPGIDAQRAYVAGCSNGGMMTYELMMRAPAGLFAAFVTNCGLPHVGHLCAPPAIRPMLHLHDPTDRTIPPEGAPSSFGGWRYERVDDVLASLGAAGGCALFDTDHWLRLDAYGEASGAGIDGSSSGNGSGISSSGERSSSGGDGGTEAAALQWLRGVSFPGGRSFVDAVGHDRCTLRAACGNHAAEIVYCTGDFGHDWPSWGAAVAWRFLRQYSTADVDLATMVRGRGNVSDATSTAEDGSENGRGDGRGQGLSRALPRCELYEEAPSHGAEVDDDEDAHLALSQLSEEGELLVASPSPAPDGGGRNQSGEDGSGNESDVCAQLGVVSLPPSSPPSHALPDVLRDTDPPLAALLPNLLQGAALLACAALLALCLRRGWRTRSRRRGGGGGGGGSGSSSRWSTDSREVELNAVAAQVAGGLSEQTDHYELNEAAEKALEESAAKLAAAKEAADAKTEAKAKILLEAQTEAAAPAASARSGRGSARRGQEQDAS